VPAKRRPHDDVREGVPVTVAVWLFLLLAALLALLVWVAVKDVGAPDPGPLTVVRAESSPGRLSLTSVGGEPLAHDEAYVTAIVDGKTHRVPLSTLDGDGVWSAGESVCVVGPPPCLVPPGEEIEVRLVVRGHLLVEARSVR